MVNLGDIAKATGYSKATVSRVLSGDPSFTAKESTRHRVIQVANELGYALRTSRAGVPQTIAVLENLDPRIPIFPTCVRHCGSVRWRT